MPHFLLKCKIHSACLKAWLRLGEQVLRGSLWRRGEGGVLVPQPIFPLQHAVPGAGTPSVKGSVSPQTGFPLTQATEALQKELCGVNNQAPTPAEM